MIESTSKETGGIGVLVQDGQGHCSLIEADKGISEVYECLSNGNVIPSKKALKNIVKNDHIQNFHQEGSEKMKAVTGNFFTEA